MPSPSSRRALTTREFVPLMALLISLPAMAIDAMLPALDQIGSELGVQHVNDAQLVVTALFVGMAIGQVIAGPLSDAVGRKLAIVGGLLTFGVGTVLALVADSFTAMLVGRALQGMGAAGPRIVCVAVVRDQYDGRAMARILSFVVAVFIVVPAMAPAIGQGILAFAHWRAIFAFLLVQALVAGAWFCLRQPETLAPSARLSPSPRRLWAAVSETLRCRTSLGYTIAAGLVYGGLLGYLSSAQQIFVGAYDVGSWFPAYFGALALAIGGASLANARLVTRLGMRVLCWRALVVITTLSVGFSLLALLRGGLPPLWQFMLYLGGCFTCLGLLFGNFNALAMEPLGHIAGTASAVIGSLTTVISLVFGFAIGRAFDGTVMPLVAGFAVLGLSALAAMTWTERGAGGEP